MLNVTKNEERLFENLHEYYSRQIWYCIAKLDGACQLLGDGNPQSLFLNEMRGAIKEFSYWWVTNAPELTKSKENLLLKDGKEVETREQLVQAVLEFQSRVNENLRVNTDPDWWPLDPVMDITTMLISYMKGTKQEEK